jgi:DNA-binding transcriptional regulator YiaG
MIPEIPETEPEAPAMDPLNINAVVVLGLPEATSAARAVWEAEGAPLPKGYDESTRANIRAWTPETNRDQTRETYKYIVHFVQDSRIERARIERQEAMKRHHAAQEDRRRLLVAQMIEVRERLGLTQADIANLINEPYGSIHEVESRAGGSYAVGRIERMLEKYESLAKLRAPKRAPKGEAKA